MFASKLVLAGLHAGSKKASFTPVLANVAKLLRYSTAAVAETPVSESGKYAYTIGKINGDAALSPLFEDTVGNHLSQLAKQNPSASVMVSNHQKITWSYHDLHKHSDALACGLIELELRPKDRLALLQGTNAEQLVIQLACAKVGATTVQMQNVKTIKDLERYLHLFRPRILVLPAKFDKVDYYKMVHELMPELHQAALGNPLRSKKFSFLKRVILTDYAHTSGTYKLQDMSFYGTFAQHESPLRRIALTALQNTKNVPALICLSPPHDVASKPVVYSQYNLLNTGYAFGQSIGLTAQDKIMVPRHLNNTLGSILANYAAITHHATLVYPSEAYNANETLKAMGSEQCTVVIGNSQDYEKMFASKELEKTKFALRMAVVDQTASDDIVNIIKMRLKVDVVHRVYGIMESSGITSINGQALPGAEMKVVRADGRIVHADVPGTLKLRGYNVALGYWNDIGLMTSDVDDEGWMNTHQKASLSRDGVLTVMTDKSYKDAIL